MATLQLSPGLMLELSERISFPSNNATTLTTGSTFPLTPLFPYDFYETNTSSGNEIVSYLKIYDGAVPVLNDLATANSRNDDALIVFNVRQTNVFSESSVFDTNPIVINTDFATAIASGTASWFRLYSHRAASGNVIHQIVGTVGLIDANPDLELGDTSIQSGMIYKISNFRLLFPSTFTY